MVIQVMTNRAFWNDGNVLDMSALPDMVNTSHMWQLRT